MEQYIVRASLGQRAKRGHMIRLTIVATVAVVGILMAVVSIIGGSYLFAALYMAAAVLGVMYAVIKINTVLPPYAAADSQRLYMNTWDNGFFPFDINFRPAFLADFIPAKTVTYEIPLSEITDMAIGTKGFMLRVLKDEKFAQKMLEISKKSKRLSELLKRVDLLYVRVKSGGIYLMSVAEFDIDELYRLVDIAEHSAKGLEFKTNVRKLRKKRESILGRE